jgi:hypothetical protein
VAVSGKVEVGGGGRRKVEVKVGKESREQR